MKKIRALISKELIRPTVYKVFRRLVYALLMALLADFFLKSRVANVKSTALALCAMLCALGAVCAYLRLDGVNIPRLPNMRKRSQDKGVLKFSSMSDHIDDIPRYTDDDLDEEETDVSIIIADAAACVILAAASFLI